MRKGERNNSDGRDEDPVVVQSKGPSSPPLKTGLHLGRFGLDLGREMSLKQLRESFDERGESFFFPLFV